jgi:cytochrome c
MRLLLRAMLPVLVAMGSFAVAGPGAAQPYDPVEMGQELVGMYCADCHAIAATGQSPFPPAPPFRELQLRYDVELLNEALVEGLTAHPDMPEFEFDPEQAAAIIAYLKSFEP